MSAAVGGPASSPKRVDSVWVTVPPIAVNLASCASSASVSQLQPTAGQQRVGGELGLQLGGDVGDQPQRAVPRLVPGRVVQQDQPAGGDLVAVAQHGAAQRVGVWREPLRGRHLFERDLGPGCHGAQLVDRARERSAGSRSRGAMGASLGARSA